MSFILWEKVILKFISTPHQKTKGQSLYMVKVFILLFFQPKKILSKYFLNIKYRYFFSFPYLKTLFSHLFP